MLRGGDQADTVLARLIQALVVEVRDSLGAPAAREIVRFEAIPADSPLYAPSLYVATLTQAGYGTLAVDSADAAGRASALVQLGLVAGRARVQVSAPRLGVVDTVTFTVQPGAPAMVLVLPQDTALGIGGSYSARGSVRDAYGNPRADPVGYSGLGGAALVSSTGMVTGQAIGRGTIVATAGARVDTAYVSVVPTGRIAATVSPRPGMPSGGVATLNLDGSSVTGVPSSSGDNEYLSWLPSGTALLEFSNGHATLIDFLGNRTLVVAPGTFAEDNWPSISTDGQWVYFRGDSSIGGPSDIYRVHPNGTGLERLAVAFAGDVTQPSPSPDGVHVAYAGGFGVRVFNTATGADSVVATSGYAPHWSPDGTWIAFNDNGVIKIVHPDGTVGRTLTPSTTYGWPMSWSPDSQWLIVEGGGTLALIQVSTDTILPLPYSSGMAEPAWKP